jgi:hypothetical protein
MVASQEGRTTRVITCGVHDIVLPPHNERGPSYLSSLAELHISPLLVSRVIISFTSHMPYYKRGHINRYSKEKPSRSFYNYGALGTNVSYINILLISISERHILAIRTKIRSSRITHSITELARSNVSEFTGQLLVKQS